MLVDIDKIQITDRIRKDFGNIEELANDIKENSLLNPITVIPTEGGLYQLIAGERRLQACKMLGYPNIVVNPVSVQDAEQALRMEISENENRKEFTFSERMNWAKRLEEIEKEKAKQSQGTRTDLTSDKILSKVDSNKEVAESSGFGNKETYRQAKFIDENADNETIKKLNDEKISIHKAYTETKRKLEEAESKAAESKEEINDLIQDNQRLNKQLSKTPVQEIKVEVISEEVKRKLSEFDALKTTYDQLYKKNSFLESQNKVLLGSSEKDKLEFVTKVSTFKTTVNDFLLKMGSLPFLGNEMRTSDPAAREYENGILKVEKWCREMRNTLFLQRKELIHEMEEIECQENC